MKTTEARIEALMTAFRRLEHDKCIEVYQLNDSFTEKDKVVQLGINWSACGTRTVEETKSFIANLQKIITFTEIFNSMEVTVDWDVQDVLIHNKTQYFKLVKVFMEALEQNRYYTVMMYCNYDNEILQKKLAEEQATEL